MLLVYLYFISLLRCFFQFLPRETFASAQIIKKDDLEDCCELAKNCAEWRESLSLHSFKHETEVSSKIELVKTAILFDPEKHTVAFSEQVYIVAEHS